LEKICDKTYLSKLRAICLFEADFLDWWNELIFARRNVSNAADDDLLPAKHFAKKGSHGVNVVMCKPFFCDISKVIHWPIGLEGVDFNQCYDCIAHQPTSIVLQSSDIPINADKVLHLAM